MTELQRGLDTVDQWFLPSDGFDLYIREAGTGAPVIIVHGGPGVEHSELVEPMSPLTERHRVLWYDQRGSLRSPYADLDQLESITFGRFSTVRAADHIIVLDRGRVIEQGDHETLLRRNGHYAELYRLQADAYTD